MSRWRDPQLQVSENYSDLTKWRSTNFKSCWLMSLFIFNMFKSWYVMCYKKCKKRTRTAPAVKGLIESIFSNLQFVTFKRVIIWTSHGAQNTPGDGSKDTDLYSGCTQHSLINIQCRINCISIQGERIEAILNQNWAITPDCYLRRFTVSCEYHHWLRQTMPFTFSHYASNAVVTANVTPNTPAA